MPDGGLTERGSGKASSGYEQTEKMYFLTGKAYEETGSAYLLIPFSYEQTAAAYKQKGPSRFLGRGLDQLISQGRDYP